MKFYPQPADSPDGVHAWVHEDLLEPPRCFGLDAAVKVSHTSSGSSLSNDPFDSFLRDLPPAPSTFAELKPLEPLNYLTATGAASPDTSAGSAIRRRLDESPSTACDSPGSQYKGAITHSNSFLGYGGPSDHQVSTTTTAALLGIKSEPPTSGYSISQEIEDIASIIGSAIADNNIQTTIGNIMLPESLMEPPEFHDIEAFFESMSGGVKVEPADSISTSGLSLSQVHTTTLSPSSPDNYGAPQTSSPMLQSLLSSSITVSNNNYLGLGSDIQYQKNGGDISMPILQARLTQGLKELANGGGMGIGVGGGMGLLKGDPMFNRTAYYQNKDSLPHSTDATTYTVTTTDDMLIGSKYDSQSYLDKIQLGSPESTDMSSTRLCLEYSGMKSSNKSRSRMNKSAKLPIATEGTKDKPIHRCTVCNRGFLNKSNIKVHLRTHTGEKPFKCETCAKAFRQKAHLLKHYQIHKRVTRD